MATAAVDGNSGIKPLSHVQGKDGEGRRRGEEKRLGLAAARARIKKGKGEKWGAPLVLLYGGRGWLGRWLKRKGHCRLLSWAGLARLGT
jgi:hypothetical protein